MSKRKTTAMPAMMSEGPTISGRPKYEVENALSTIAQAEIVKRDRGLMKAVRFLHKQQGKAITGKR